MQEEGFPVGTIVGKVLFTTATPAEAPFLTNPIEWLAYTTPSFGEMEYHRVRGWQGSYE